MNFKIKNYKKKIISISNRINKKVSRIINYFKKYKDDGLVKLIQKYEKRKIKKKQLIIKLKNIDFSKLKKKKKKILISCRNNIIKYHKLQKKKIGESWFFKNKDFEILGQRLIPIKKVGVYSPGGKTIYPSSIFMSIIPAKISGVKKISLFTPVKLKKKNLPVFFAAKICGIKKIYNIGGAQAIAAMTFGSKRIKKVNKIVGPGNNFVNETKKKVFGKVGLANLAGPTEIIIIFDKKNKKKRIIYELFSQIEHDENCFSVLICNNKKYINSIIKKIKLIKKKKPIKFSINNCIFIYEKKIKDCFKISNYFAPEHLSVLIKNSKKYIKYIRSAGTVFIGKKTYESMGDYSIGSNHVLPTEKSSKFSSPLGVYDFYKIVNFIKIKKKKKYKKIASGMSKLEKLKYHRKSLKK